MEKFFLLYLVFVTSLTFGQTAEEYISRGNTKTYFKDYNGSIVDYSKAIEVDSNFSLAYYNRGISKYNLQNYNEAILDYDKAIELNPNYSDAYTNRGISKSKL